MKTLVFLLLSVFIIESTFAQNTKQSASSKTNSKATKSAKKSTSSKKTQKTTIATNKASRPERTEDKLLIVTPSQIDSKKSPEIIYSPLRPYTRKTGAEKGTLNMMNQLEEKARLDELASQPQPKKWYLKIDSENMKNVTENNPRGYKGDIYGFQSFSFGYKFTDSSTIQVTQDWSNWYGYGATSEGKENIARNSRDDISFRYLNSSLFKIGEGNVSGQLRYYAPSSVNSQNSGTIGQIRVYMVYSRPLDTKWTFNYLLNPRYFMQTANAFETEDEKIINNNHWRLLNSASVNYAVTDWLSLETSLGVYTKKRYNESSKHFQDYSTYFNLKMGPIFSFTGGVRASDEAWDTRQKGGFNFYDMDFSEFYGILSIRI